MARQWGSCVAAGGSAQFGVSDRVQPLAPARAQEWKQVHQPPQEKEEERHERPQNRNGRAEPVCVVTAGGQGASLQEL